MAIGYDAVGSRMWRENGTHASCDQGWDVHTRIIREVTRDLAVTL